LTHITITGWVWAICATCCADWASSSGNAYWTDILS